MRGKLLIPVALLLALAAIATGCEPDESAYSAIKLDVLASPWSSETGPIPPPEGDEWTMLSADGAEAQVEAQEAELAAAGATCCHREFMIDRGAASFSIYFTERATRWICNNGPAGIGAISGSSILVGQWMNYLAVWAGFIGAKTCQASADTNCLRIRVYYWMAFAGAYNVESGHRWCRVDWRTVT